MSQWGSLLCLRQYQQLERILNDNLGM